MIHPVHKRNGQLNHVLILDDEEDSRRLIARIANDAGYDVSVAANTEEFILQFSISKPSFLVLDIFLGQENVESIFRFLRNQRYVEPVALVSGYAIREMDSLVADALCKGILIAGLFEKSSMVYGLRKHLEVYFRGVRVAN